MCDTDVNLCVRAI